jgi:hypothetical protein
MAFGHWKFNADSLPMCRVGLQVFEHVELVEGGVETSAVLNWFSHNHPKSWIKPMGSLGLPDSPEPWARFVF